MSDSMPIAAGLAEPAAEELAPVGTADVDGAATETPSTALQRLEPVLGLVSPLTSSPGAPLETTNFIRSLQPSLMPRTSLHQGRGERFVGVDRQSREHPGGEADQQAHRRIGIR